MICRFALVAALVATALSLSAQTAVACGCADLPVCARTAGGAGVSAADAIFIGRVLEHGTTVTRFLIERTIVGGSAQELTLGPLVGLAGKTGNVVSTCDMRFMVGERYLVYARRHRETGDLVTSQCAGNQLLSDYHARADLAYLDARARGISTNGWVSGIVEEGSYATGEWVGRRLAGVRVIARPPAGPAKVAVTNDDGVYMFSGLTPSWRITADLPSVYRPHDSVFGRRDGSETPGVVWLPGLTCAEADIHALRRPP